MTGQAHGRGPLEAAGPLLADRGAGGGLHDRPGTAAGLLALVRAAGGGARLAWAFGAGWVQCVWAITVELGGTPWHAMTVSTRKHWAMARALWRWQREAR